MHRNGIVKFCKFIISQLLLFLLSIILALFLGFYSYYPPKPAVIYPRAPRRPPQPKIEFSLMRTYFREGGGFEELPLIPVIVIERFFIQDKFFIASVIFWWVMLNALRKSRPKLFGK